MTSADPAGGGAAGRDPETPRRLSPPPPLYHASDEISLEDPAVDPVEPVVPPARATLRHSGPEPAGRPTGPDIRVGRPFRLFWLWIGPHSSALGLVIGAALFSLGMSVGQAIAAAAVGTLLAAVLLVAGVLEGRRTGLPGEFAASASFGVIGGRVTSVVAVLVRVLWGALLLWMFAAVVAGLIGVTALAPILLGSGVVIAGAVAAAGYRVVALFQLGATVLGSILVIIVIAGSATRVDLPVAMGVGDGPPLLVLGGTVVVFSVVALTVVPGSAAIGRYQGAGARPVTAMWSILAVLLPVVAIVGWGALVAAGGSTDAGALVSAPVDGLAALLPTWAGFAVAMAAGLGLLSALVLTVYGGGFALQATGAPLSRIPAIAVTVVVTGVVAFPFAVASPDALVLLRDVIPTLAVPVGAASAVVAGRALAVRRLSRRGRASVAGVRWYEFTVFVAAVAVGYGLMTGGPAWLSWQGYLFAAVGTPLDGELAASDPGVLVAVVIGSLAAFSAGARRPRTRGGTHRVAAVRDEGDR